MSSYDSPAEKPDPGSGAPRPDGRALVAEDPYLEPYAEALWARCRAYAEARERIEAAGGWAGPLTRGHEYFGLTRGTRDGASGLWYREWAPGAEGLALVGDFNGWDRQAHALARGEGGIWHLFLPDGEAQPAHGERLKVHVRGGDGSALDRIPAWIRWVREDPAGSGHFVGVHWDPPEAQRYRWRHAAPGALAGEGLRIYEAHAGMAVEAPRVGTWDEFTDQVLPRIAALGYNAVQLMAVQEHPYYGSFGYHVSNFFAPSSRFGTPEALMRLVDTAHGLGLRVIMDLVHSHAVKNVNEGLNRFDGTAAQYFHAGARGEHPAWDSLLFDYGKLQVQRFLLSNVRYWLETFRFDGFRFDGVTSMLYHDHGLERAFTTYEDYFGSNVDGEATAYLMLANELAHALRPEVITIAEEMSGMPGLARPVAEGGLGFDHRLAMGVPDYWIRTLKTRRDEGWDLHELFHELMNRRAGEKHIGYVESHDQAMVGDKTVAFRLMDEAMYRSMSREAQDPVIDRGLALHKLIRLVTFSLAGQGYLNFMGNEFGHPEWIDFPREGNGYSYHYARRQWSLVDREELRYQGLARFDRAMQALDKAPGLLTDPFIELLAVREAEKVLVYRRGPRVFAFNFHPTDSHEALRIPVPDAADYHLELDSDDPAFEGHGRVQTGMRYPLQPVAEAGCAQSVQLYLPSRTAQVVRPAGAWT